MRGPFQRPDAVIVPPLMFAAVTMLGSMVYLAAPQIARQSALWPALGQATYAWNAMFLLGSLMVLLGLLLGDSRVEAMGCGSIATGWMVFVLITSSDKQLAAFTSEWFGTAAALYWSARIGMLMHWSRDGRV